MLHSARRAAPGWPSPALAAGVLLLAGCPGVRRRHRARLQRHAGRHDDRPGRQARRRVRHPELGRRPTARSRTLADVRPGAAEGRRRGQGRGRPPDHVARARHGRDQVDEAAVRTRPRPGCGAQLLALDGPQPGPQGGADRLAHRARRSPTPKGKPTGRVRARHGGLLQAHARRPAGHRPGREAARSRSPATAASRSSRTRCASSSAARSVPIISPAEAAKQCAALYDADVRQGDADARLPVARALGAVKHDLPDLHVQPVGRARARRPTARSRPCRASRRRPTFKATLRGGAVIRRRVGRPAAPRPYTYKWSSSTTVHRRPSATRTSSTSATPRDGKLARRDADARGHRRQRPDRDRDRPLRRRRQRVRRLDARRRRLRQARASARPTSASRTWSTSGSARRTRRRASRT